MKRCLNAPQQYYSRQCCKVLRYCTRVSLTLSFLSFLGEILKSTVQSRLLQNTHGDTKQIQCKRERNKIILKRCRKHTQKCSDFFFMKTVNKHETTLTFTLPKTTPKKNFLTCGRKNAEEKTRKYYREKREREKTGLKIVGNKNKIFSSERKEKVWNTFT